MWSVQGHGKERSRVLTVEQKGSGRESHGSTGASVGSPGRIVRLHPLSPLLYARSSAPPVAFTSLAPGMRSGDFSHQSSFRPRGYN
ncbi:hypothetical protein CDAR_412751 [Caerostris darwini]|uniref:Uncharacterized protein n=1 Tax=Caerostris darwini TaxID=1538125 RepID=A0AAV4Q686_9ARAC|nr:hypothetical protein CDAR_412751 [Caerostris darwini]